ncbi:MAG: hypothetical protein M3198_14800 [Actinomycetota bacterium]|nr:hypothetical protein [Actinomycetota bacterium]
MDAVFIEGAAATISSIIVFCGSVFLLLAMIMGARLAYFVTASVTLAFLLIMGLIWSKDPLGPVGKLPEWDPVSVVEQGEPLEGPSAGEYPDGGGWRKIDDESTQEAAQSAELGSSAQDVIAEEIERGNLPDNAEANTADTDTIRFLEQDGELYGAVVLEPPASTEENASGTLAADEGAEEDAEPAPPVVALLQYDPGNPLGKARIFTLGTFILLAIHLFFLSRSEQRARRAKEAATT